MLAVDFFFCTIEALGTLTFSVVTVSFSDAFVDDLVEATMAVFGTLAVTVSFRDAADEHELFLVGAELAVFCMLLTFSVPKVSFNDAFDPFLEDKIMVEEALPILGTLASSVCKRATVSGSILVSAEGISGWLVLWAFVLSLAIEALIIDNVKDFAEDVYVEALSKYLSMSGLSLFCYHKNIIIIKAAKCLPHQVFQHLFSGYQWIPQLMLLSVFITFM